MTAGLYEATWFAAGVMVGGLFVGWMRGDVIRILTDMLRESRKAEEVATDRLVHAWHGGAQIPARPAPPVPPPDPLPPVLLEELSQWEDPEHRSTLEGEMRAALARGKSPVAILLELDNKHP